MFVSLKRYKKIMKSYGETVELNRRILDLMGEVQKNNTELIKLCGQLLSENKALIIEVEKLKEGVE